MLPYDFPVRLLITAGQPPQRELLRTFLIRFVEQEVDPPDPLWSVKDETDGLLSRLVRQPPRPGARCQGGFDWVGRVFRRDFNLG